MKSLEYREIEQLGDRYQRVRSILFDRNPWITFSHFVLAPAFYEEWARSQRQTLTPQNTEHYAISSQEA